MASDKELINTIAILMGVTAYSAIICERLGTPLAYTLAVGVGGAVIYINLS